MEAVQLFVAGAVAATKVAELTGAKAELTTKLLLPSNVTEIAVELYLV